jgi:hypothetical protein
MGFAGFVSRGEGLRGPESYLFRCRRVWRTLECFARLAGGRQRELPKDCAANLFALNGCCEASAHCGRERISLIISAEFHGRRSAARCTRCRGAESVPLAVFFCLLAVAAQLLLLPIHSFELNAERSHAPSLRCSCRAVHHGESAGPGIEASDPRKVPVHSHHDPCSCPICQTILRSSQCLMPTAGVTLLFLAPAVLARLFEAQVKMSPSLLIHGARSPPHLS